MKLDRTNRRIALLMMAGMLGCASVHGESENAASPTACALDFDGVQSYVDISTAATNLGDFTVAGWFKIRNKGSRQFLFRMTNQEGGTRRLQITEQEGAVTADIRPKAGGPIYSLSSSNFCYNKWLHVAFVREGDQLRLYFNGRQVEAATTVAGPLEVPRWAFLGANTFRESDGRFGHADNYFDGSIDEVQLWTVARTSKEIADSLTGIVGPAKGLHAYWRFNERRGDKVLDSSVHEFVGRATYTRWTLPFFEITGLEPPDGTIFMDTAEGVRFSVCSGEGALEPTNIVLMLNGRDQSARLRITGTEHERYVEFRHLGADEFYRAEIRVTNSRGEHLRKAICFNTFRPVEYQRRVVWVGWSIGGGCFAVACGWGIVGRVARRRELAALRARLARDIHDEIGSNLAGMVVLSETARGSLGTVAEQQEDWGEIHHIARQTLESMREVLWLVAEKEEIEFDLVKQMGLVARRMLVGKEVCWEATIEQPLPEWRLEDRRQVFLFFKEALTNIVRHAEATRVVLAARISQNSFQLQIADNGRGFELDKMKPGIGMNSQRMRVKSLGGVMQVLTRPGQGTRIGLDVPMRKPRKPWRWLTAGFRKGI